MTSPAGLLNADGPPRRDYIILGGVPSPGRATVVSPGSPRKWDKQGGYGITGATLAFAGDDLTEFDVWIDLWEDDHWIAWKPFAKVLDSRPRGRFSPEGAFEIVHPALNRSPCRVSAVVVLDVVGPDQVSDGMDRYVLKLSAYRQPKVALGKPPAAVPSADVKKPTVQTAEDKAIADLLAEQARLGGAL